MTMKQIQFLEQEIAEYIACYPEDIGVWVTRLIIIVEDRQTNENMGTDPLELGATTEEDYYYWYKDLYDPTKMADYVRERLDRMERDLIKFVFDADGDKADKVLLKE